MPRTERSIMASATSNLHKTIHSAQPLGDPRSPSPEVPRACQRLGEGVTQLLDPDATPRPVSPSFRLHIPGTGDAAVTSPTTPLEAVEEYVLKLLANLQQRTSAHSHADHMHTTYLYIQVASTVHSLLAAQHLATQRDVYYRLEKHFPSQLHCNRAIAHLSSRTGLSRSALNIAASGRGAVGGCLRYNGIDLRTLGPQGLSIDGSMVWLGAIHTATNNAQMESGIDQTLTSMPSPPGAIDTMGAQYLLIVEKDAVFYRLMDAKLFHHLPVISLSGFGFPSAAARSLAAAICDAAAQRGGGMGPPLQVFGVVDYNPSGVQIMLNYMAVGCQEAAGNDCRGATPSSHRRGAARMDIAQSAFSRGALECAPLTAFDNHGLCEEASSHNPRGSGVSSGGLAAMRWLGVRPKHLGHHHHDHHHQQRQLHATLHTTKSIIGATPLTERDRRMLSKMLKNFSDDGPDELPLPPVSVNSRSVSVPRSWLLELRDMQRRGVRFDIELWYHQDEKGSLPSPPWVSSVVSSILMGDCI